MCMGSGILLHGTGGSIEGSDSTAIGRRITLIGKRMVGVGLGMTVKDQFSSFGVDTPPAYAPGEIDSIWTFSLDGMATMTTSGSALGKTSDVFRITHPTNRSQRAKKKKKKKKTHRVRDSPIPINAEDADRARRRESVKE